MFIALVVFFGLSLLILGHEVGHFFAARLLGLKVEEFGFGFPPRIFAWRKGETEYSVNWLLFGGFVRIAGENDRLRGELAGLERLPPEEKKKYFLFQSAWKRSAVILAGVFVNFLLGWALLATLFMVGIPRALVVGGVQPGSPAEMVGMRSGDVIRDFTSADAFVDFVDMHRGEEIEVRIRRGEKDLVFHASPRIETKPGEGALGVHLAETGVERRGFFGAVARGFFEAASIFWQTIRSFYDLLRNLFLAGAIPEDVAGPVGIFAIAQETGKLGLLYLLQLLALISVNLSVLNCVPFPALDGGRFFLIMLEKLRGRPISLKTEALVNGLGFVFLMLLIAGVTIQDIARLL